MTELRDYLSVAQLLATLILFPLLKHLFHIERRISKIEALLEVIIERRGDPRP